MNIRNLFSTAVLVCAISLLARASAPPPLFEIGSDGRGGAWLTIGPDESLITINNAGETSFTNCAKPKVVTAGEITMIACGEKFQKSIAQAVKSEWVKRSK